MDDFRQVGAVLVGVVAAGELFVTEFLLGMGAGDPDLRDPVDHVDGQAEAVDLVLDGQLQGVLMLPFSL